MSTASDHFRRPETPDLLCGACGHVLLADYWTLIAAASPPAILALAMTCPTCGAVTRTDPEAPGTEGPGQSARRA